MNQSTNKQNCEWEMPNHDYYFLHVQKGFRLLANAAIDCAIRTPYILPRFSSRSWCLRLCISMPFWSDGWFRIVISRLHKLTSLRNSAPSAEERRAKIRGSKYPWLTMRSHNLFTPVSNQFPSRIWSQHQHQSVNHRLNLHFVSFIGRRPF